MKVAILTWFHYHNYGTALQVCALSQKIKEMGHEVDIVNYRPQGQIVAFPTEGMLKYYIDKITNRLKEHGWNTYYGKERETLFDDFYAENLSFTDECVTFSDFRELNKCYDAFVCGSDQIWAPSRFNPRYYLDFVENTDKMIAYAPSVGLSTIDDIDIASEMSKLASRFKWISTREKSGSKLLEKLIGDKVETVVDPTLLLRENDWDKFMPLEDSSFEKKYLLAYFLRGNEKYWKKVRGIAQLLELELKIIPVFTKDMDRMGCIKTPVGPKEFLNLVKNASFVCTDSFHGTAFAINFKRQFLTFERFRKGENNNQNSRIYNILELCELQNRLFSKEYTNAKVREQINYVDVEKRIEVEREHSLRYLMSALKHTEECKETVARKRNYVGYQNSICCGCTACERVCPVGAVSISDKNGFKTAVVDSEACISCGKCVNVCPLYGQATRKKIENSQLYSYKDFDDDILKESSSGGAAYRIAMMYLERGYSVVGCMFDSKEQRAKHVVIHPHEIEKLPLLQGSKYMQSDFTDAIHEIVEGDSPLVIFGTPCQISAARKVAPAEKDIIYVDLICHGVPSQLVYAKYLEYLKERYHMNSKNLKVFFRDKLHGWRNIYIRCTNNEKEYYGHQSKDPYFRIFESGLCYSEACYECRWRASSEADVRLGDYWGNKFEKDSTGVSMIISFNQTGDNIINCLQEYGNVSEQEIDDYFKWQQSKNNPKPVFYERLFEDMKNKSIRIESIVREYIQPFEQRNKISKSATSVYGSIRRIIKKL